MTKPEFDAAVDQLLIQFGGSVVSGRRTGAHNQAVGGVAGGPHVWGLAVDVVWDVNPSLESVYNPTTRLYDESAYAEAVVNAGLHVIRESTHDHLQPLGWVNTPVVLPTVAA